MVRWDTGSAGYALNLGFESVFLRSNIPVNPTNAAARERTAILGKSGPISQRAFLDAAEKLQ